MTEGEGSYTPTLRPLPLLEAFLLSFLGPLFSFQSFKIFILLKFSSPLSKAPKCGLGTIQYSHFQGLGGFGGAWVPRKWTCWLHELLRDELRRSTPMADPYSQLSLPAGHHILLSEADFYFPP